MIQTYLDRLAFQFKDSPNLQGLLTAHLTDFENLSITYGDLLDDRTLDTAEGVQLDGLGSIVGVKRPSGTDDTQYRTLVKFKIQVNKTAMTNDDVLEMISFGFDNVPVRYTLLETTEPTYTIGRLLTPFEIDVVIPILPVLIGLERPLYITHNNTPFGFAGDSAAFGFGSLTDSNVGGNLATIIN